MAKQIATNFLHAGVHIPLWCEFSALLHRTRSSSFHPVSWAWPWGLLWLMGPGENVKTRGLKSACALESLPSCCWEPLAIV